MSGYRYIMAGLRVALLDVYKRQCRHRVDFRSFFERVAKSTTLNRQEVEAVLNYATEIARDIVERCV